MSREAVVILPVDEYEDLLEGKRLLDRVLLHGTPVANRDEQERVADVFIEHYDPQTYGDGWGHVSFCFSRALDALLGKS